MGGGGLFCVNVWWKCLLFVSNFSFTHLFLCLYVYLFIHLVGCLGVVAVFLTVHMHSV